MAAEIRILINSQGSGSGLADARRDVRDLGETAGNAGGGFNLLKTAGTVALAAVAAAAVAGAAAIGKFVADSIGKASEFESGMNAFGAAAGQGFEPGTEGLKDFHDLFIDLGKRLPVSTKEVQDAAIALVKGGIDPAVIRAGALEASLKFAAAAGMGLEEAAELTVKQLGTFVDVGASVEEQTTFMAEAQELLVKAAGASTLNVDKLGDAMLASAGAAKASGVQYEDFVTTMGLISPSFGSAAEAGTSYRNFLARLIPTTEKAKGAMMDLGLMTEAGASKFYDSEGAFIGNREAAELLQNALSGLSDAERAEAMQTIFGQDAKGAAIALMNQGAEGYDVFAEKMRNANGVAEQSAAVQQGLSFAWDNFKGSVEALQIVIGEKFLPILAELVNNYLTPAINTVMTFTDAIFGSDEAFNQLSPTLQIIAGLIGDLVGEGGGFGVLADDLREMTGIDVSPLLTAIQGLTATFNAAETPVQGFLDVLAEVSPAFALIRGVVEAVMPTILTIIQTVLGQIMVFWTYHGTEVMAFVQTTWATLQSIIQLATELISGVILGFLLIIRDFIAAHGTEIQAIFENVWIVISNIIGGALEIIKGILQAALAIFKGDWQGAWTAIQTMSVNVTKRLWEIIKAALDLIANLMGTSLRGIYDLWVHNWEMMKVIFFLLWNQIKAFFEGILSGMVGWVIQTMQGIANAIVGFAGTARSAAGGVASAIVGGITSGIESGASAIINAAKDAAMAALEAAKHALGISSPSKVFAAEIGKPMAQGMAQGLAQGAPMVAGAASYAAGAGVSGGRSQVYNSSFTYAPTINGGSMDAPLDYALAASLAGV